MSSDRWEESAPPSLDDIRLLRSPEPEAGLGARTSVPSAPAPVVPLPGSATAIPRIETTADYESIDWMWVEELRGLAATQLASQLTRTASATGSSAAESEESDAASFLAEADEAARRAARQVVSDVLDDSIKDRMRAGTLVVGDINRDLMVQAVIDALFGMGRIQPLLDREEIENIEFFGPNRVLLEHSDSHLEEGPSRIFGTEENIRSYVSFIASRDGGRAFSQARPNLDLTLKGGERLSASSWVSAMTYLTIRKHRLKDITLDELVDRDELSPLAAGYLAAMVKSRHSIVVAGQQGAGKTTLLRALCREIDPEEAIGTFETEFELGLHELPYFRRVKAFEARPGSGERGVDGRQAGEITVDDLLYASFRMNLARQIVGEVRGREVLAMIKAMQSSSGSLSTTHAANASGAVAKLITCALEAGPHVTLDYARRAVADHIDLVVFVSRADVVDAKGQARRLRYVSEISEVTRSDDAPEGYSVTSIFEVGDDSPYVALPRTQSEILASLDPRLFNAVDFTAQLEMRPQA